MRIIVQIRGNPRPQQRHRHKKQGKFVITYDPSSKDKDDFLAQIISKAPKEPFDEPLRVDLYFYMNRPKSHFGTGKNHGTLKKSAPTRSILLTNAIRGTLYLSACLQTVSD